jgi:archaellum component FlaC
MSSSSQNTAQASINVSITSRFENGEQVAAIQAIETTLQRLQSDFNTMRDETKDLPGEINALRNKFSDLKNQLSVIISSATLASTIQALTTQARAAINTRTEEGKKAINGEIKKFLTNSTIYAEEAVRKEEIPDKVSKEVIKQLETESMQTVLKDYAKKVLASEAANDIFDKMQWMVDQAKEDIMKEIDKVNKEITAKIGTIGRTMDLVQR